MAKEQPIKRGRQVGKHLRFEILKRDKFTCQYCGKKPPEVTLEVDHIKLALDGGGNNPENLTTACRDCNRGKYNTKIEEEPRKVKRRFRRTKLQVIKGEHPNDLKKNGKGGRPTLDKQIPEAKIANLLMKNYGILSEVAKQLKCTDGNICIRIKNSPRLQTALINAKERVKDQMEYNLVEECFDKKKIDIEHERLRWQKAKFYMKTQMQDRGYKEETKDPGSGEGPITINITPAMGVSIQSGEIEDAKIIEEKELAVPVGAMPGGEDD